PDEQGADLELRFGAPSGRAELELVHGSVYRQGSLGAEWRSSSPAGRPGSGRSPTIGTMSEIADVLEAIEALSRQGQKMALATIVAVLGPSSRHRGTRPLGPSR